MMKLKRVLGAVCAAVMIAGAQGVLPEGLSSVIEAEAVNYYGNFQYEKLSDGTVKIVKYRGTDSTAANVPEKIGTGAVSTIGESAFAGHTELYIVRLPDSVKTIEKEAFRGCSGLTNYTMSANVESIGTRAYYGCSSLKDLTLPDSITSIGTYAFAECDTFYNITLPAGLKSVPAYLFDGCDKLTYVKFTKGVQTFNFNAFGNCPNHEYIKVDSDNPYYSEWNGVVYSKDMKELVYCPRANSCTSTLTNTEAIGDRAFESCTEITKLKLNSNLKSIGRSAFKGCIGLSELELGAKVGSVGEKAFYGCRSLSKVTVNGRHTVINDDAFDRNASDLYGLKIYCYSGSKALEFAQKNNIIYVLLDGDGKSVCVDYNTSDESMIPESDSAIFMSKDRSYTYAGNILDEIIKVPESLADGKYTLLVGGNLSGKAAAFRRRSYDVTIKNGAITEDIKPALNFIGDINADGKLNATDLLLVKSHIKGVKVLTGYELDCADIDANGKVNASDLLKMKAHIKGVSKLW